MSFRKWLLIAKNTIVRFQIRHVLKNKLNIGREIVIMRCQRVFNGVDNKGNKPIVVNFQVSKLW